MRTFNGQLFFEIPPSKDIKYTFFDKYKMIGDSYNKRDAYSFYYGQLQLGLEFDQVNNRERLKLFNFFNNIKGRKENFYIRTYSCILEVLEPVSSDGTVIKVKNTDLEYHYYSISSSLYIFRDDFTDLPKVVVAEKDVNDFTIEYLILDKPAGVPIPIGAKLEFVFDVRMVEDSLSFKLVQKGYTTVSFSVITAKLGE